LLRADGVLIGRDMSQLPGAVHFIAQTAELDGVRLMAAVGDVHVRVMRPGGQLQYSTQLRASSGVPVPRLTVNIGVHPILRQSLIYSSVM
jgi:hypothetical protein